MQEALDDSGPRQVFAMRSARDEEESLGEHGAKFKRAIEHAI